MKKLLFVLALSLFSISFSLAQEKGFFIDLATRAETISLNGHKEYASLNISFAPGYAFNSRLFARAQFDGVIATWDRGRNARTYIPNGTIGPSIGYYIMKDKGYGVIDISASVGHSLAVKEWRYVYYDLGFNWGINLNPGSKLKSRPFLGVGIRYNDTYRSNLDDYLNIYVQFGFRF